MKTQIFKTYSDFLEREDQKINGVSGEFAKENPKYEEDNESNEGCWNCSYCSYCSYCNKLDHGNNKKEDKTNSWFKVPKIENIHTKILEATSKEGALNMEKWHTCDTTHCRAGWVEFLAGKEGKELAEKTSILFAAMHIYKESSDIHVGCNKFFDTNEVAMADIKRCAELEVKQTKN